MFDYGLIKSPKYSILLVLSFLFACETAVQPEQQELD